MREQFDALRAALLGHPISIWLVRTWNGFFAHRNLVNASALTYTTMLAVVPLVAVVLSLLKAFGFADALRPFMLKQFPVVQAETVDSVLEYIDRANALSVGTVGLAALVITCWTMLRNVESSLNHIFGARENRSYLRQAAEYPTMLVLGAVMVVASIAGRTVMQSPALFERVMTEQVATGASGFGLWLLPWVTAWLAFFFMYTWMPNCRVSWRAALFGAIVGGTLFQGVQLAYIEAQLGFARYHAVYGALAQLPIILVWVYFSWVVVLVGAEGISARATLHVAPAPASERLTPDLIALAALREVVLAFDDARPTPRADELGVLLGVDTQEVRAAVQPLLKADILIEPGDGRGYLPGSSPQAISIDAVLGELRKASQLGTS